MFDTQVGDEGLKNLTSLTKLETLLIGKSKVTEAGQKAKFVASTDVQNLEQVKKGDVITVVYTEALAYEVRKHGTTEEGTGGRAQVSNRSDRMSAVRNCRMA